MSLLTAVSVIAVLKGTDEPDRYLVMRGDIDSRVTDVMDFTSDSLSRNLARYIDRIADQLLFERMYD